MPDQFSVPSQPAKGGAAFDMEGPRQPLIQQLCLTASMAHLSLRQFSRLVTREYILTALEANGWSQGAAARDLGMHRNNLRDWMVKLRIERPRGRVKVFQKGGQGESLQEPLSGGCELDRIRPASVQGGTAARRAGGRP